MNAIGFITAGEYDESVGPKPGFSRRDMDRAREKLTEHLAGEATWSDVDRKAKP
jgi:hypothetical protein